jgi:hypothetical protein
LGLDVGFAKVSVASTNAVCLLGGVDQQEEECESARGDRALLNRQTVDLAQQLIEGRSISLPMTPGAGSGA